MDKEIEITGKKIFYRVYGSGKPVILLHGFGETGDVWENQVDFLQDKFMLIVPDLPGSGQSDMIDDMSMEGMAEVIKAIIDSMQKENTNTLESSQVLPFGEDLGGAESPKAPSFRGGLVGLIGHSMGGYITLAFAEKYPDYLNAFGLFHSTAYPDNEEKKATRLKGIEFIKENGAFEFLKTASPNLFSADTKQRFPELIDQFIQSLNNFLPEALVSYYQAMMQRPDRTSVLKNATLPVLFILGKYDTAVPLEDGLKRAPGPSAAVSLSGWKPPADLPEGGVLRRAGIPGTSSGFESREAYVYLPPAYQASPRPALPVLVLFAGQPGAPADWLTGGALRSRMDRYAAAHQGVAPVVVVVDPNGSAAGNTLCMDSTIARADTFLAEDVPAWINRTLDVDPDPKQWAAGGFSFGATCAL